jgi:4-hydroxybenzoate polyprenyltransferase
MVYGGMPWFRLVRWKNLCIIFATQFLVWYFVVLPVGPEYLALPNFLVLVASTLLIAASGYIINDYFDIKIDNINRPQNVVLGNAINPRKAIAIHAILNTIALALSCYLALLEHRLWLPLVQLSCTLLLWFYSTHFKKAYVIGNVVVSWLTALSVFMPALYEPAVFGHVGGIAMGSGKNHASPLAVILNYAYFAFVMNWMREIVKDMEDCIGDAAEGCVTMPIVKGLRYSVKFTMGLAACSVIPLLGVSWLAFAHQEFLLSVYLPVMLVLPITLWCVQLTHAKVPTDFMRSSRLLKIIMIMGVGSLPVFYLQTFFNT